MRQYIHKEIERLSNKEKDDKEEDNTFYKKDDISYAYASFCHGGGVVFAFLDIKERKDFTARHVAKEIKAGNYIERLTTADLKEKSFGCQKCGYCQRNKLYDSRS